MFVDLYKVEEILIQLKPLAKWCRADFVEERVHAIKANDKTIHFENGDATNFDLLSVNVGSRTKGTSKIPGVKEHSLQTRPINELLGKIESRE